MVDVWDMENWEKVYTLEQFVAQEHRHLEGFATHAADDDQGPRLSTEAWVELYNDYLAGLDSGEIEDPETAKCSNRALEWNRFAALVARHIDEYTIPQYGDAPGDQLSSFSAEDIVTQIERYLNRVGRNARGPEEGLKDMLKVAHYACALHAKLAGGADDEAGEVAP